MCNNVQLAIIKIWCKRHSKDFESGGLEWIRLYARTFRQIMNNTIEQLPCGGFAVLPLQQALASNSKCTGFGSFTAALPATKGAILVTTILNEPIDKGPGYEIL